MILVVDNCLESPILANFENLALGFFTKYYNYLGVCSIFAKNLTNLQYKLNKLTAVELEIFSHKNVSLVLGKSSVIPFVKSISRYVKG